MKTPSIVNDQNQTVYPQVLVVGMSRTGTSSIKRALETLYEAPVYHASVVLNKPKHLTFWSNLASGATDTNEADVKSLLKNLLKGYIATTDLPSAYYFELLTKTFPEAKVILSTRDEKAWVESYCRLIKAGQRFRLVKFLPPLNRLWPFGEQMHQLIFGKTVVDSNGNVDRAAVLAGYRNHNQRVVNTISPDNLLIFDVRQGWQPLCDFLGKAVPASPFPNLNAGIDGPTKIIASAVSRLSIPIMVIITLLVTLLIVVIR